MTNRILIALILGLMLAPALAFGQAKKTVEMWTVADKTVECTGVAKQQCFVVSGNGTPKWTLFYDKIAGFKFRDGFTQKVQVEITAVPKPAAGASAFKYRLVKVVSSVKTDGKTIAEANKQFDADRIPVLAGRNWALEKIDGAPAGIDTATLRFDAGSKRFGIKICNQFSGQYDQIGLELKIGRVISTKMMCRDPLAGIEYRFQEALAKVNRAEASGERLLLMADKTPVLEFVEKVSLEGVRWAVTEVDGKKVVTSGDVPYIQLVNASLSGFTGCNQLFGGYKRNGAALNFGDVGMTKMECTEDGLIQIEIGILDAIKKTDRFEIKNGALVLFAGQRALMTLNAIPN